MLGSEALVSAAKSEHCFVGTRFDGPLHFRGHREWPPSGRSATVFEISSSTSRSDGESGERMWYCTSRDARSGSRSSASVRSAADSALTMGSKVSPVSDAKLSCVRGSSGVRGGRMRSSGSGNGQNLRRKCLQHSRQCFALLRRCDYLRHAFGRLRGCCSGNPGRRALFRRCLSLVAVEQDTAARRCLPSGQVAAPGRNSVLTETRASAAERIVQYTV